MKSAKKNRENMWGLLKKHSFCINGIAIKVLGRVGRETPERILSCKKENGRI